MSWAASPSPGWYPDPEQPANLRWWDGTTWTDYRTPTWQPPTAWAAGPGPGTGTSNADLTYLLPVNRDGFAIASGYLGLFSVIPNPLTSTAAIVCGFVGLNRMKHTRQLGRRRAWFGIVAGVLSLVVFAFLLVAVATWDPNGSNSSGRSATTNDPGRSAIARANLDSAAGIVRQAMQMRPNGSITEADLESFGAGYTWDIPNAPIGGPGMIGEAVISTYISRTSPQYVVLALPGSGRCYFVEVKDGSPNQYGVDSSGDATSHCFIGQAPDGESQVPPATEWYANWPAG